MVVELCYSETLDVVNNYRVKPYIKNALDVINFMVKNNLNSINNHDHRFMSLTFDNNISFPKQLYGDSNHCTPLYSCKGRLPSFGNVLCYLSEYWNNIQVSLIDKENDVCFYLTLYTHGVEAVRRGVMFDTEKFE